MPNRRQLVQQVRFALNNLAARNGHYEFEALCREVARQTVTPNLVPATGPVAGGGDQGRDFESFRSRVASRLGETGLLLGLDGTDLVAFACTLQQTGVDAKIRSDLTTICSDGEPVAAVVIYTEANVTAARRHALQHWAREEWDVAVEVIDGEALSELLAGQNLFWAATEHLAIPAELAPEVTDLAEYGTTLERWQARADDPRTFGDFLGLRDGLRDATFTPEHRGDLPFWLSRMRLLINSQSSEIARRARYEVIVGTLRGLGHLRAANDLELVQALLEDAQSSTDAAELEDASIILMYCIGAWVRRLINLTSEELTEWNAALRQRAELLLEGETLEGRRCALYDVLGALYSQPDTQRLSQPTEPVPFDVDEAMEIIDAGVTANGANVDLPLVDRDLAIANWVELARMLQTNWAYPIEGLMDRVTFFSPLLSRTDGYRELVALLDAALARTAGRSAVAERCRDRALAHYRAGRVRDALFEFDRARVEWLTGDTLRGSLLAEQFVADCYMTLELPLAARYFWLATVRLASRRPDLVDMVAPALFGAAKADYHAGSWFACLDTLERAFRAHAVLAQDPWDLTRHEHVQYGLLELTIIDACAQRVGGPAREASQGVIDRIGARSIIDEATPDDPWWESLDTDALGQRVLEELGHVGFADAGPERVIAWRALGVDWRIRTANQYGAVVAAERIGAVMQVVAAELSAHELLIMPTSVEIELLTRSATQARMEPMFLPSNEGRRWRVRVLDPSGHEQSPEAFSEALVLIFDVLGDLSLLERDRLDQLVRQALSEGIVERFAPMLLYDEVVPIDEAEFASSRRAAGQMMPPYEANPSEHADLALPSSTGPGFDPAQSLEMVRTRYERMRELFPLSIPRMWADEGVRRVWTGLAEQGWKDWHVLQALTSLIMGYRVSLLGLEHPDAMQEAGRRLSQVPETPESPPLPVDRVTADSMRDALRMSMLVSIRNWPLELRQATPDFPAIERFLGARYRFWDDDIPHERWWEA